MASASPIQSVTSQEVVLSGRPSTIDILNQLPQVTQVAGVDLGPTSDALSGPGGVSTVDLRGLGPQRTLVLVDGRRLGVGDPNTGNPNPAPDINQIPSQLIDRIDVLTGGASAVYGSDAVAGVVNFVMKHNFEGVQIDAQYGVYQHGQQNSFMQGLERASGNTVPGSAWDGGSRDYSLIMGVNAPDQKGNVTAFFTYDTQDPVKQGARDYSGCQLKVTGSTPFCTGSSNSNIFYAADGSGGTYSVLGGNFIDYGSAPTTPPAIFNANPYEYLLQQNTRYTAGFFANYVVNDHFEAYSSFNFMDSVSNVNVGPSALFQGEGVTASGGFLVNCNNPLLSANEQAGLQCSPTEIANGATKDIYIGRRNIEGGPRNSYFDHTNYRIVLGGRGTIVGPWKYDAYASYYSTTLLTKDENYLSLSKAQDALLVGGTAANPVCLSGNPACVPYDIFQQGGVSSAAAASLVELGTSTGTTTEQIIEGDVTGDLTQYGVKSPWARRGVSVALGGAQRRDTLSFSPDAAEESGDISGFGGAAVKIDRSLSVKEGYFETNVPVASDLFLISDLTVDGGYRYSQYSTGAVAKTFKAELQWRPIDDILLRASFNRAIRAPSILELYTPLLRTNTSEVGTDPCAGPTPTATLVQCERTGVTAAEYGSIPQCISSQCATQLGGNPDLKPESADTYSVGATFRPRLVRGFTASLDYYHIQETGLIGNIPLASLLSGCLNTGDPTFCSQIVRNPVNGNIFTTAQGVDGYINGTLVNVAAGENAGLEAQMSYALPLADWGVDNAGKISFDFNGSYLLKNTTIQLPGEPAYDCAGLFGPNCQGTFPRWRHVFHANWTMPWAAVTVTATWRYIGGATYESDSTQPIIGNVANTPSDTPFSHKLAAISYLDLSGKWRINDKFSLRAGVNNVFDQDPPIVPNSVVGGALPNTYSTYDLEGRRLFVGVTASF